MEELNYWVITEGADVAAAVEQLAGHGELGFDTETTALNPFEGRVRLVQLASAAGVYLFDLDRLAPGGTAAASPDLEPLRRLLAAKRPVKVAHNCLAGDMLVSMADGTKVRIDKLVRAKARGKVLCVDESTGALSEGEIVGWVDGGLRPWADWLRIRTRGKGVLRVTRDHEILTERGRVRAEHLLVGDKILTTLPDLSQRQRDMLYGSLLGDGSLTKQGAAKARTPHFKVSHSVAQGGYVALKAAALDGLVKLIKTEKVHRRGFSNSAAGSQLVSLTTKSDPRLFELHDACLTSGKRAITPAWLEHFTEPAMAVWYCDDGSLVRGSSASICASGFGAEGADKLVGFLQGRGFPARLWVRPDGQLYVKIVGPYGRGMSEGLKRFWENIAPYVPASMRYKLPEAYRHLSSDEYWLAPQKTGLRAFSDTVVEISALLNDSPERGRYEGRRRGQSRGIRQYCLEVAPHHNFIAGGLAVSNCKFDAKWVRHHLGVELAGEGGEAAGGDGANGTVERGGLFDTLLASQLLSAGEQEDRHGLGVVAERYLGQTVDKSQQVSDWSGELSAAQLEYAARDAALMLPLRARLVEELRKNALGRCAQLEFECVVPLAALELAGVHLDRPCWSAKLKEIERQRNELREQLQEELAEEPAQQSLFGPARADINLDSHVQLTRALKRVLPEGEEIPDSTRNWKLEPLAVKYEVVRRILDYRTLQKTLKFGETLLESVSPVTGRIHSHFHQIGAPTGRMSSTDPNVQQIPHAFDMRRCFRAPAGRKLITADYSQIELRILADFTGDRGFVEAFNSGADLHRVTAAQVFGVAVEDVTKQQRDFAKRLNFGVVYGIGAQRFALLTGLATTEAEDLLRRYFATYRDLDMWLRDAAMKATRERTAPRTVAGRLFRFNFDPEDKQAASAAQRNGKNAPIQGCVNAGTRIFERARGYVPIETLAGEDVCVWDGTRFSEARVAYSGRKRLVKVTLWGGHYIECSPDHRFLTTDVNGRRKWRTPSEFVKGCWVALGEPVPAWSCGPSFPPLKVGAAHNASRASLADMADAAGLGTWLGRLASDGSLGPRQANLLVAEHEEVLLPEIKRLCESFGHVSHRVGKGGRGPRRLHHLTVSALGLCGQLNASGVKTRIPDFAWQDSRLLAGYLRGMFDGDGTVTPDGPALCFGQGDKHLGWAREVQQALLLFGVRSRINVCADRINVCVLKRDTAFFARVIGFMNPSKQEKVGAIISRQVDGKIYGRAARVKSVVVTDTWVDMYDVVDSETGRFMANGLVTHNSSADIIKRALRLLHDRLKGTGASVVNVVHDEIVVETDEGEAEEVAKAVERAMCAAGEDYVKKVPVKVEYAISDEWAK